MLRQSFSLIYEFRRALNKILSDDSNINGAATVRTH
jgi:hypothetical protein